MKCPRCHSETETCALVPPEVRDGLLTHQSADAVFSRACESCRNIFSQLLATPSLIENKVDPKELKKMILWRSRGDYVKAGIMAFKDYNYDESLLHYLNYIKVLEETFGKPRSELNQKIFDEMGKSDEFTTYLFVLWDLIAIYDRGQPEQQAQICSEFSALIKDTSFVPTMARKARIAARTSKNPALYKQLNKELGGGKSCFVATAVFGNTFAPEVLALREFRDDVLEKHFAGRFLTSFYYVVAPFFGSVISENSWLAKALKFPLTLLSTRLAQVSSIQIYTDGSLKNNVGSWAYLVLVNNQVVHESSGRVITPTTSLRMEIQAAIEALTYLETCAHFQQKNLRKKNVRLYTDSRVLTEIAIQKAPAWKDNGWVKKNGKPIPDIDFILKLNAATEKIKIEWTWIPAHRGHFYNDRCDQLCTLARSS